MEGGVNYTFVMLDMLLRTIMLHVLEAMIWAFVFSVAFLVVAHIMRGRE